MKKRGPSLKIVDFLSGLSDVVHSTWYCFRYHSFMQYSILLGLENSL